jgi:hypothetical protein
MGRREPDDKVGRRAHGTGGRTFKILDQRGII